MQILSARRADAAPGSAPQARDGARQIPRSGPADRALASPSSSIAAILGPWPPRWARGATELRSWPPSAS